MSVPGFDPFSGIAERDRHFVPFKLRLQYAGSNTLT